MNWTAYEALIKAYIFQVDAEGNVTEIKVNKGEYPFFVKGGKLYYYGKNRSVYVREIDIKGKSEPQVLYTLPDYKNERGTKKYVQITFDISEDEVNIIGKRPSSGGNGGEDLLATFSLDVEADT